MPAQSKAQQKFMGAVYALKKGDLKPSDATPAVRKVAKDMKKSDAKDFASTKHKKLPNKVRKEIVKRLRDEGKVGYPQVGNYAIPSFPKKRKHGDTNNLGKRDKNNNSGQPDLEERLFVPSAFDKALDRMKFNQFTPNNIKKLSKKFKVDYKDAVEYIKQNKVINVANKPTMAEASKEAMGIAGFTGTRGVAVDDFIKKNKIDARKLFNFVRKGNLRDRMDFVTAIAGKPNNKFHKMIVSRFAESINERARFGVVAKYGGFEMVEKSNQSAFIISKNGKTVGQLKRTSKYLKDDIKRFIKMVKDGKIKDVKSYKTIESVNEAFVVAYGKREGSKPLKPAFAAYADKKMAQKFMADMKRDGFKVMMTQKKIKGIDEDKKQIVQLKKKVGKKEIKFYDALSKLEKKMGKKKYRDFLVKSLKDFKVNGNHYDYRTNAAAEEKLFQLAK